MSEHRSLFENDGAVQGRRLSIGARFNDYCGKQVFVKIGECTVVKTRQKLHILRCVKSPFVKIPGPVSAAFFCAIGDVVYRGGSLRVYPIEVAA